MSKKNENITVTKDEERINFYNEFKKAFDTKTLSAIAHESASFAECEYVHIFENEVKTQRCYYKRKSAKAFYFVLNRREAEKFLELDEASEHEIITRLCRVPLDEEKQLKQLAIYIDASTSAKECAKFAKRLCAIAQMTAKEQQKKQATKEAKEA